MTSLRDSLRQGNSSLGLAVSLNCAGTIERIGRDWDWIWIDAQHGQFAYHDVLSAVRAAEIVGSRSVIRPPGKSPEWLSIYADLAPAGIMVPMVNNTREARDVVEALRFPPLGRRSFGSRRAIDLHGSKYYSERDLFVMAQVETIESVENAEAIIATEGVDCLFFGANDVKLDMGVSQEAPLSELPQLQAAMRRTALVAQQAGKCAGCVATTSALIRVALEMGYQILASGADHQFLREGSVAALNLAKGVSSALPDVTFMTQANPTRTVM